jgi:hypothetical protein
MTSAEISELIRVREGRLCVRFYRRADGAMLTQDCPVGLRDALRAAAQRAERRMAKVAGAVLSALVGVGNAFGQTAASQTSSQQPSSQTRTPATSPVAQTSEGTCALSFQFVDPQRAVIAGLDVWLTSAPSGAKSQNALKLHAQTDSNGYVHFKNLSPGTYLLVVKAELWKEYKKWITVAEQSTEGAQISLEVSGATAEVVVGVMDEVPIFETFTSTVITVFPADGRPSPMPPLQNRGPLTPLKP